MNFKASHIAYSETGFFSKLVEDFVSGDPQLDGFLSFMVKDFDPGKIVSTRKQFPTNRKALVSALHHQYDGSGANPKVLENIAALAEDNCFTVCTAHQPNIFTGHLYFVYKILHAIKLADHFQSIDPEHKYVPVYYMGNEDADLEELGEITIDGARYRWETPQTGAVGKMLVDDTLIALINKIDKRLSVLPFGAEVMNLIRQCYLAGTTIEQATFRLVNALFGKYGLLVLIPDNPILKAQFKEVVKKELHEEFSSSATASTHQKFPVQYNAQPLGREVNLFYLKGNIRGRIIKSGSFFSVNNHPEIDIADIDNLVANEPEVFSPNVVLRPLYQEMILPDVAFIGGGGEIAYWAQLKSVFEAANVFYPLLVLRNSFAIVNKKTAGNISALGFSDEEIFQPGLQQQKLWLDKRDLLPDLSAPVEELRKTADQLSGIAGPVDPTLLKFIAAREASWLKDVDALEKKLLRKLKRNESEAMNRVSEVRQRLLPGGSLQERVENILIFIAQYGFEFFDELLHHSFSLEQKFTILSEQ